MLLGPNRERLIELLCISFTRLPDLDDFVRNKLTSRVDYRTSEQTLPQAASSLIDRLAEADLLRTFLNEFEKDFPNHSVDIAKIRRAPSADKTPERPWISPRLTSREAVPFILTVAAAVIFTPPFTSKIIWIIFAPMVAMAVWLAWKLFRKRSRLLQREKFLIRPDDSNCFVGRDDEVSQLSSLCNRRPLVMVLGESGSGKSTLAKFGLLPKFTPTATEIPHWHAVLLDGAGIVHWKDGIGKELDRQLKLLPKDMRKNLGAESWTEGQDVFGWINCWPTTTASRLLVVIDQLDDYFETHRQHLMQGSVLLAPEELLAANRDWSQLNELLQNERIHILLISRNDSLADRVFRVCPSADFLVQRVDANLVAPLLDQISAPDENGPVVENADAGWTKLSRRLMDDLGRRGGVLMIQLVITLDSLRRCDWLDLNEFTRRGGVDGLGRIYVDRRIEEAAQLSGLSERTLLQCLFSLTSMDGNKTKSVPTNDFVQQLSAETITSLNQRERAINAFCQNRILRRRSSIDGELLQLYHDYLARPVRDSYRLANAEAELLQSRAQEFAQANTRGERWKLRLTMVEQLRLFYAWLRGRLTYGTGIELARRSLFNSMAIATVVFCLMVLLRVEFVQWKERTVAERLIGQLGELDQLSSAEFKALTQLSESDLNVRRLAFEVGLSDTHFDKVVTNLPVFIHSSIGLVDHVGSFAESIVKRMETEIDSTYLFNLGIAFGSLSAKLDQTQISRAAELIAKRMETEIDSENLSRLGYAIRRLSAKLDQAQVSPAAELIVKRMETENDSDNLSSLGSALGGLSAKLDQTQVSRAAEFIVKHMETENDSGNLSTLGSALGGLSAKLDQTQVSRAAGVIVKQIETETDSVYLSSLGSALGSLSAKLDQTQVSRAAELIVKRMQTENDYNDRLTLSVALGSLSAELDQALVLPLAASVVERMETEKDSYKSYLLGTVLGSLSAKLDQTQASRAAELIIKRMETDDDSDYLPSLGYTLGILSANLDKTQVSLAAELIVKQLEKSQVSHAETLTVKREETVYDSYKFYSLGTALRSLSAKLDQTLVSRAAKLIVKRMEIENDSDNLSNLGETLGSLSANLDQAQTSHAAALIIKRMDTENDSRNLYFLGRALGSLSSKMDRDDLLNVYTHFLKSPLVSDHTRDLLLKHLDESGALGDPKLYVGENKDLDIWKFVDWAKDPVRGGKYQLDLRQTPAAKAQFRQLVDRLH